MLSRIQELFEQGKFEKALATIDSIDQNDREKCIWGRIWKSRIHNRQGSFQEALAILDDLAQTSEADKVQQFACCVVRARILRKLGRFDEARNLLETSINCEPSENPYWQMVAKNTLGIVYHSTGRLDEAESNYLEALQLSKKIHNKSVQAATLSNLAEIHRNRGDLESCEKKHLKALQLRREVGEPTSIGISYNNLGIIYNKKGDLEKSLEYFKKSLAIKEKVGNIQNISKALNNIGSIYLDRGQVTLALEYFTRSLELKRIHSNPRDIAISLHNIGKAYDLQGDYDTALQYFEEALSLKSLVGNPLDMADTYARIGFVHYYKNNTELALQFLDHPLQIYQEIGDDIDASLPLYLIVRIKLEESRDDYKNELKRLESIHLNYPSNARVEQRYNIVRALELKSRKSTASLIEAQELFHSVVDSPIIDSELNCYALIQLTGIALDEFSLYGEQEVLDEISQYLESLFHLAGNHNLHGVAIFTLLLQSRMKLLVGDIPQALSILDQAEQRAEKLDMPHQSSRIIQQRKQLENDIFRWKDLSEQSDSIIARLEASKIREYIENIKKTLI